MNCLRLATATLILSLAALVWSPGAHAAESYDNCTGFLDSLPATISTQGTWCLRKDVSTSISSGTAITIGANNVTLDCNNFKVGGLAAGTGTTTTGIGMLDRLNATVRNCNVRGFYVGIESTQGGGHVLERNTLDGNTHSGIRVESPGSVIRNNIIVDTGGSSGSPFQSYGIRVRGGVDVLDNAINGVAPSGSDANAFGVYTSENADGSVNRNRISGLASSGTGTVYGIYNHSSGRTIIRDNDLRADAQSGSVGVRCSDNQATARDNVIAGFATGVESCVSSSDTINVN